MKNPTAIDKELASRAETVAEDLSRSERKFSDIDTYYEKKTK